MNLVYWHNPRCTKSRQGLALLGEKGIAPEIRLYQQDLPTADEIRSLASKLQFGSVREMMRTKEAAYRERGLADVDDEIFLIAVSVTSENRERPGIRHDFGIALRTDAALDVETRYQESET